ncbi:hypothetical protein [Coleofasciculus chthonoplastes]|uniref:hypothetical protein n=1 Tax=Coleofasciculus chthonoplastes TaxID=64178 RepID=UPI0032FF5A21
MSTNDLFDQIDAPEAWDIETGNNIVVGVIDTGINYPDLLRAEVWVFSSPKVIEQAKTSA